MTTPTYMQYHDYYSLQIWCRKNERKIRLFLDINTKIHTLAIVSEQTTKVVACVYFRIQKKDQCD